MLIKHNSPCFAEYGGQTFRPGCTEVVPASMAELKDFKDAVKSGKITIMSRDGEPESPDAKPWETLEGDDLLEYVQGLLDVAELEELKGYTSSDKKLQAAVRKAAKATLDEINAMKDEAGA